LSGFRDCSRLFWIDEACHRYTIR